ncbi:DUF4270 domain-containing protein [Myroides sp. M-43]|uniref:DUF4270 domain-containing protein n=1 Tax=Myroides oncorhynchi TaxID=2893756 RepID=UPI001E5D6E48|nr:DUF4270 domain-containing protein [Myroides oncorhynchi]MCC9042274.1 DUF4270 domain-containing protein [Myroides oncorhynchi]
MNQKKIVKGISLVLGLFALQACESDYTSTGNDLVGGGDFDIVSYRVNDFKAYNQTYGPVDGSRLIEVPFGYLDNGVFGATSSDLVLQLNESSTVVSGVGDNVKVDSVYVYIPYFSQFDKVEEKVNKYKLKNVYGEGSIDLKVYQNKYHLMDVDLSDGSISKFYTDMGSSFDSNKVGEVLNKKTNFSFDNSEIVIYKKDKDGNPIKDEKTGDHLIKERLNPGMWLDLNESYFEKFITENKSKLSDVNGFNELFKGFYLKTNQATNGSKGVVGLLNLTGAKMVVILHDDKKTTDADGKETITRERKELSISIGTNVIGSKKFSVNVFNTLNDGGYQSGVSNANKEQGDQSIYLRGGQGSMAVLEVFRADDFKELKAIKEDGGLLNDAYLTVFVDKERMSGLPIPERLFLYDFDNSMVLTDFGNDAVSTAQYLKYGYGGIFVKEDKENNKEGYYYRFRVTDHIRGLLKSKNNVSPKLGLIVANNYAVAGYTNQKTRNVINNTPTNINVIPSLSVSCPVGVVLHGANAVDESKRMKLEIYYTKAKNKK